MLLVISCTKIELFIWGRGLLKCLCIDELNTEVHNTTFLGLFLLGKALSFSSICAVS